MVNGWRKNRNEPGESMVCWRDNVARGFVILFWRNHGNEIFRRPFCDFVGSKPVACGVLLLLSLIFCALFCFSLFLFPPFDFELYLKNEFLVSFKLTVCCYRFRLTRHLSNLLSASHLCCAFIGDVDDFNHFIKRHRAPPARLSIYTHIQIYVNGYSSAIIFVQSFLMTRVKYVINFPLLLFTDFQLVAPNVLINLWYFPNKT